MRTCQSRRKSAEPPLNNKTPKPSFYSPFFYSPFALLQCQKEIAAAFGIKWDRQRLRIAFTTKPWNLHEVDSECVEAVYEAAKLCEALATKLCEALATTSRSLRPGSTKPHSAMLSGSLSPLKPAPNSHLRKKCSGARRRQGCRN